MLKAWVILAIHISAQHWSESLNQPEWWVVVAAFLTLFVISWQSIETRRAAEATQKSAAAVEGQSVILRDSVDAAEKSADAARDSAMTARISAETLIHAERAWILAELSWYEGTSGRILVGDFREGEGPIFTSTTANLKLTCRNEGKSPAWIDKVYGRIDIVSTRADIKDYDRQDCGNFGSMEPIGAAAEKSRSLSLVGDGRLGKEVFLSIYVIIDYHDIFGHLRETTLGYSLSFSGDLNRQDALPTHNRNT